MNKVAVIGSANTDMVVKTARFPNPGETVLGGQFFMFPGGKGANQAVAAARVGADVQFFCALGDDTFGDQAVFGYQQEGIRTNAIYRVPETASGIALITVNENGENEIVVAPGANSKLNESYLSQHLNLLKQASLVLAQLEIPIATISFLASYCQSRNIPLILNPAPAQPLHVEILNGLYAITPNQSEAELLTGIKIEDLLTAEASAKILRELGVKNVVITLGKAGALYVGEEGSFHEEAPIVQAVDTTAAGDVFNGVLATTLASGLGWKKSIQRANSAAALSVTRMGAQSSAPFLKELPSNF